MGYTGEQRFTRHVEPDQDVARRVGRRQIDDSGGDTVEDAAMYEWQQRQADIAGMNTAAQHGAERFVMARNINVTAGKLQPRQIVGLVRDDPGL